MPAKIVQKSYIVFSWSPFGIKLYLSHLGYYLGNRYCYVWEPGFENARHFDTKEDALAHAERARAMLPTHTKYSVALFRVREDDTTDIKSVFTGGIQ